MENKKSYDKEELQKMLNSVKEASFLYEMQYASDFEHMIGILIRYHNDKKLISETINSLGSLIVLLENKLKENV